MNLNIGTYLKKYKKKHIYLLKNEILKNTNVKILYLVKQFTRNHIS